MLFKYPNLLWLLFLLLIPILIHLFQLRRFKKTPFTNVKVLQQLVAESRRSHSLKKWLLLGARILLLSALILAFAQPFFPEKKALKPQQTIIYLDNSYSMQALTGSTSLLENKVQELLAAVPPENTINLFTNNSTLQDVYLRDIQNELLALPHTSKQLTLEAIYRKAKTLFGPTADVENNLIVISDFQDRMLPIPTDSLQANIHLVQAVPSGPTNISLDTLYIQTLSPEKLDLVCRLSSGQKGGNTPVSLYQGERLIAKTAADFKEGHQAEVIFSLPAQEAITGKILISDAGLPYDNQLYFNIDQKEKIRVLVLGEAPSDFLERIYNETEFEYAATGLSALDYGNIARQNLIILNGLPHLPAALQPVLTSFVQGGGSLAIIPSPDLDRDSFNQLLGPIAKTQYNAPIPEEQKITKIQFEHPLYQQVFEEQIGNFQYPTVKSYYPVKSALPPMLSYENGEPFIMGTTGVYIFSASLDTEESNFIQSPLVVPTFYNMGWNSLKLPRFYELIGTNATVDLPLVLARDRIVHLLGNDGEFIPLQQPHANKITLSFNDLPTNAGTYTVLEGSSPRGHISFNEPREESKLQYLDPNALQASTRSLDIPTVFEQLEKDHSINELWKWFIILALVFSMAEVLIQKYLK